MKRAHTMPFGAQPVAGGTRFSLWAPGVTHVDLEIRPAGGGPLRTARLEPDADGWCSAVIEGVTAGARYRYRIDGGDLAVPDPASRFQPDDVHGMSEVVDPRAHAWRDEAWRGRPWHEAVVYELHVGTFTPEGTFAAAARQLDHLAETGITAVELMPLADFPGGRDWGYNGVQLFAPDSRYGRPEDLKAFVDAAHARGLMVVLDVVYNHFGPEGNYLHVLAPPFFDESRHTPWGAALNLDGERSATVREFFVHNALFWLDEYHLDGLRFDAVHAIEPAARDLLFDQIADAVHALEPRDRHVHLVLENDANQAHFLERRPAARQRHFDAQWNDDAHHALHVLLSGETGGYYADYADDPARHLARCLAEGFAYQGEPSAYREGARRGEPSGHLPPTAFVNFLQNHDQVGNRALGERIDALAPAEAVEAALSVLLLAPSPPLLFMGEEWGATTPFLFFCDLGDDLKDSVREGRRREFARFPQFSDATAREAIPDPTVAATFEASRLDWSRRDLPPHAARLAHMRELLALRHAHVTPRLGGLEGGAARFTTLGARGLSVVWSLDDGSALTLAANLGPEPAPSALDHPEGRALHVTGRAEAVPDGGLSLGAWSVAWHIAEKGGAR